jgi:HPt (histidine-containing phosphotransfer) domain-containing protein
MEKKGECNLEKGAEFKKILDLDKMLMKNIVELSLESFPKKINDIYESIVICDAKKVEQHAHALKGTLGYFGAKSIYDLAYNLEIMGKQDDLKGASEVFQKLKYKLEEMCLFFSIPGWEERLKA